MSHPDTPSEVKDYSLCCWEYYQPIATCYVPSPETAFKLLLAEERPPTSRLYPLPRNSTVNMGAL